MNIFPNIRKFVASSDLFSGFELDIDLNYCNSLDDIVNIIIKDIKQKIIIFFTILTSLNKTKNMIKLIKNFIELDLSPVITTDANKVRIINEVRYILKLILISLNFITKKPTNIKENA